MKLIYKNINQVPELIPQICDWYFEQWQIEKKVTELKLSNCGTKIPLQIVVFADNSAIATGGIYNEVNIHKVEPRFSQFSPWFALLYTVPTMRGKGVGSYLCDSLDIEAKRLNIDKFYLYTHTAQSLYRRKGWIEMEIFVHKEKHIYVMSKTLNQTVNAG